MVHARRHSIFFSLGLALGVTQLITTSDMNKQDGR